MVSIACKVHDEAGGAPPLPSASTHLAFTFHCVQERRGTYTIIMNSNEQAIYCAAHFRSVDNIRKGRRKVKVREQSNKILVIGLAVIQR